MLTLSAFIMSAPEHAKALTKALSDAGRDKQVVFVGHDVTALTRRLLLQGVMRCRDLAEPRT